MNEYINQQYNNLYEESADFRAFVESMEKYSTEEIAALYELKLDVISCSAGLLEKLA